MTAGKIRQRAKSIKIDVNASGRSSIIHDLMVEAKAKASGATRVGRPGGAGCAATKPLPVPVDHRAAPRNCRAFSSTDLPKAPGIFAPPWLAPW